MDDIAKQLLQGSANIDTMRAKIHALTNMLFGLAKDPGYWIRSHELERDYRNFHTTFGDIEVNGCEWAIYWDQSENKFRTRCLAYSEVDGERQIVCAYGNPSHEPHMSQFRSWENTGPAYPQLSLNGIILAYQALEVFANGMLHDFPLQLKIEPFMKAAKLQL